MSVNPSIEQRIEAIEKRNQSLEESVAQIKLRNKEVEINKSWEGSWTRKVLVALFTYLSIGFYFQYILQADPWVNAIVPTIGFLLSTLTLSYFKKLWMRYLYKKD